MKATLSTASFITHIHSVCSVPLENPASSTHTPVPTVCLRTDVSSSSLGQRLAHCAWHITFTGSSLQSVGRVQPCGAFQVGQKYDTFRRWLLSVSVGFLLPEPSLVKAISSMPIMVSRGQQVLPKYSLKKAGSRYLIKRSSTTQLGIISVF